LWLTYAFKVTFVAMVVLIKVFFVYFEVDCLCTAACCTNG
jgi:hypothetical protein